MKAVFYRKLRQPLQSAFLVALLVLSLLGTQWIGFSHGIAHSNPSVSTVSLSAPSQSCNESLALSHTSATCHLFDALTLAGFIPPAANLLPEQYNYRDTPPSSSQIAFDQATTAAYQSQGPPNFIL